MNTDAQMQLKRSLSAQALFELSCLRLVVVLVMMPGKDILAGLPVASVVVAASVVLSEVNVCSLIAFPAYRVFASPHCC